MTTRRFARRLTVAAPTLPKPPDVKLSQPTELPQTVGGNRLVRVLLPLIMVVAMGGMVVMMVRSGGGFNPMMIMFPIMMIASFGGVMFSGNGGSKRTADLNADRKEYLLHLASNRDDLLDAMQQKFDVDRFFFPGPEMLASLVGSDRQWMTQRNKNPYLVARIGVGRVLGDTRLALQSSPEAAPTELLDPLQTVLLSKFLKAFNTVGNSVITIKVDQYPALGFTGDLSASRDAVRALVCHLALFTGPDHLMIAAVTSDPDDPQWQWLKWLPHNQHPTHRDGAGSARMIYRSVDELAEKVGVYERGPFARAQDTASSDIPFLLVVCDGDVSGAISKGQVCWLQIGAATGTLASTNGVVFDIAADRDCVKVQRQERGPLRREHLGLIDALSTEDAAVVARRLSRFRLGSLAAQYEDEQIEVVDRSLAGLIGVRDIGAVDLGTQWRSFAPSDPRRLRVPIGWDDAGRVVELDLKETGHGPHGLVVGTTGSGKSEFLRSVLDALVLTHSPDDLALVLVDYKGDAAYPGMNKLPHVAALITNMEEEADLLDRLDAVLRGEVDRRQRMLREYGHKITGKSFKNVEDYNEARRAGADIPPLPALLICVDEVASLLKDHDYLADLFVHIGRQGRALWMHLLFASQDYMASKMAAVESNSDYRVALRTGSSDVSRSLIGSADAFSLPKIPGIGYFKTSAGRVRFNAVYTGSVYEPPTDDAALTADPATAARRQLPDYVAPQIFTADTVASPPDDVVDVVADNDSDGGTTTQAPPPPVPAAATASILQRRTVYDVIISQLHGKGTTRAMWLPELRLPRTMDQLIPDWRHTQRDDLAFPVALMDVPRAQEQRVWSVLTGGQGGHIGVVGLSQAGKSTALQDIILGAAATHSPDLVQFYCIDSTNQMLAVESLPHVGMVATSSEAQWRVLAVMEQILTSRVPLFQELGIADMREFRRRKAAGDEQLQRRDEFGDVYLVVDGYDELVHHENGPFHDARPRFETLAKRGLGFGVHLVLSGSSWIGIAPAGVRNSLQTRLELKLSEAGESLVDVAVARKVPAVAGRSIGAPQDGAGGAGSHHHMMTVLPRLDGVADPDGIRSAMSDAAVQLSDKYGDRRAPRVRLLPTRLALEEVSDVRPTGARIDRLAAVRWGMRQSTLTPAVANFVASPHMVFYGAAQSGKSTALATVVRSLVQTFSADEAAFVLIDPRRTHIDLFADCPERLQAEESNIGEISKLMTHLATMASQRLPTERVTGRERRDRSWWSGRDVFVVIDDFSMTVPPTLMNPYDALMPLIPHGADIGLHLIVARNIAGASSAVNVGLLQQLKMVNTSGFILDGPHTELMLVDNTTKPARQIHKGRGLFIEPNSDRIDTVQSALPPVTDGT